MGWITNNVLLPISLIVAIIAGIFALHKDIKKYKEEKANNISDAILENSIYLNPKTKEKTSFRKKLKFWLIGIVICCCMIGLGVLINSHVTSSNPVHLQLEFATKQESDPDGSIVFDILGGSIDPSTVFEVYAHACGPADFPVIGSTDYYKSFTLSSLYHYHWMNAEFSSQTLYTVLVVQKNGDTITGYSDLCTFYMTPNDNGIYGHQHKYLPKWPNPSGAQVASKRSDGVFYDTDGKRYLLTISGDKGALVTDTSSIEGFNSVTGDWNDPDYLVYKNKQQTGEYVRKFFVVDNDITPNADYPSTTGRDEIFRGMTSDYYRFNVIEGVVRTEPNINGLLP